MTKLLLTEEESKVLSKNILIHCYSEDSINQDMIDNVAVVIIKSLEKIMEQRNKPTDPYSYLISEDELRVIFEKQHVGRNLQRGRLGTYQSPPIAAIWNQHLNTARVIEKLIRVKL